MAFGQQSRYGLVFWLQSAVQATGLLLGGGILVLTVILAHSQIQADGFSWATVGNSVLAAVFWTILALIGTCYVSIPIATLLTGGVRMLCHELLPALRGLVRSAPTPLRQ